MRNKLFYYLCWLTAVTSSLQAQAQNKVAAPMKDVNQVIDNTLDSLNKARTARPIAGSSRKGDNPVLFLVGNSTMGILCGRLLRSGQDHSRESRIGRNQQPYFL